MQLSKFVVKCGNFAVLVDLHILPSGAEDNASWFTPEHRKEVVSLLQDAVEQRVRQFLETRHQKIQPKQRKDLNLIAPLCIEGGNVRLAVYFMKRHVNLRCVVRQHYRELRVFPERFVVRASPPENAGLPNGNLNLDVSGQSRSKYFSSPGETVDPLPNSTATKRAALQKIARQANAQTRHQRDDRGSVSAQPQVDAVKEESGEGLCPRTLLTGVSLETAHPQEEVRAVWSSEIRNNDDKGSDTALDKLSEQLLKDQTFPNTQLRPEATGVRRKQRTPSGSGEDTDCQKAKRLCLGDAAIQSDSPKPSSSGISAEEELLTHGNNTAAQTNQSRLAASLRGLSVKPVSSGCSISSRSSAKEERRGSALRTSRLRRLKKS